MLRKNAALVKAHVSLTSHVSWRPRKYDRPRSRVERTTDEAVAYRDVKDVWRYAHEPGAVAHDSLDSPASVVDGQPILFDAKRPDHHLWGSWWLPRPLRESTSILRYIALGLPTRHGTHDSVDVSYTLSLFTLSQASHPIGSLIGAAGRGSPSPSEIGPADPVTTGRPKPSTSGTPRGAVVCYDGPLRGGRRGPAGRRRAWTKTKHPIVLLSGR